MAVPKSLTASRVNTALEMVRQNPSITYQQIADALGIGRTAIRNWVRNDTCNWNERYKQTLKEAFNALEGPAIQAMSNLIEQNNFQAAKYILDNKNYGATQKISADVNGDITLDVTIEEE